MFLVIQSGVGKLERFEITEIKSFFLKTLLYILVDDLLNQFKLNNGSKNGYAYTCILNSNHLIELTSTICGKM